MDTLKELEDDVENKKLYNNNTFLQREYRIHPDERPLSYRRLFW